jgi:hypothetical protein
LLSFSTIIADLKLHSIQDVKLDKLPLYWEPDHPMEGGVRPSQRVGEGNLPL